ncbi:hypothetical protein A2W14_06630 [Candidatus Gottesmanbacteria bacterium RBG_16_37_8]|uniref:Methyltransferase type 11 domain-containing protein n=1 Tax=Candidatus Gottesmanbacteria bacterium RBG_16_37_8 TaxID=1798371 RepID=A0A1F5YRQ5_9BACT|nr:MAG: hypothetical protein A2W14_06630 [Candidatus Gottesmanbacteria bacterium RBG_16_37_8]
MGKLRKKGGYCVQSDLNIIPFRLNTFDIVCAFEVLEHLSNDQEVLINLARVLKNDGKIFISVPLHEKLFNEYDRAVGHVKRYNPEDIEVLFKNAGLTIEKFSGMDVPWPSNKSAKLLVFLERNFPWFIPVSIKAIDSLPFTSSRRPIQLKDWDLTAAQNELAKVSTGFFVLKKQF